MAKSKKPTTKSEAKKEVVIEKAKPAEVKAESVPANAIEYECPACGYKTLLAPNSHDRCRWCKLKHKHVRMETSRGLAIRRAGITHAEPKSA